MINIIFLNPCNKFTLFNLNLKLSNGDFDGVQSFVLTKFHLFEAFCADFSRTKKLYERLSNNIKNLNYNTYKVKFKEGLGITI